MIVALDIQHAGKPGAWRDRGAVWDGVEEVDLTRAYAFAAEHVLRRRGVDVVVLSDGEYSTRWSRTNMYDPACYIACHANAGLGGRAGQRGEVYHWPGSSQGMPLAAEIAGRMTRLWPTRALAASTDRVQNTIRGVQAPAICFEPAFLDAGDNGARWLVAHADDIGTALAEGILAWGRP